MVEQLNDIPKALAWKTPFEFQVQVSMEDYLERLRAIHGKRLVISKLQVLIEDTDHTTSKRFALSFRQGRNGFAWLLGTIESLSPDSIQVSGIAGRDRSEQIFMAIFAVPICIIMVLSSHLDVRGIAVMMGFLIFGYWSFRLDSSHGAKTLIREIGALGDEVSTTSRPRIENA